ncbi:MAG: PAS domain S-box protein [Deltaproteobacteria bacterium]|nr:PAS domain S-box protein [Deltaproteobacteria bacterium]
MASYRSVAGGRVFAFFRDLSHRQRSEVLTRTRLELARLAETSSVDVLLRFALDTAKSLTESGTGFFDFVDEEKGRGRVGFPPGHMARARELVVPIHRGSRVVAAIGVGNKASPYTDEDLDTLSTLADVVIDTVARRWAEAQLQASEARYRSLVENMEDIVYSLDDEGRLSYVSGAISHLGYRPADVMGQGLDAIVHPEDGTAATTRGVARLNQELRVVDWSGAVRTMRDTRRALEDEDGAISGYVGVLTDLTQQRQTEEALRLAQKMEAIGRLAGGVAHDFNNLLSVILSLTGFALEDLPPGSPLRADLQDVLKAGERASTLTRQLLAFSRRQVLSPKVVSLNRVVEEMQGMLRRLIGEDIELVSRLSEEDTRVRVDVGQLEQVILNLAVNARDAMPTGGQLLLETNPTEVTGDESELQLTVPPGPYARLRITDTGVGMDDATAAGSSSPSSPRRSTARAPAWGWPRCTASSTRAAAASWSTVSRAAGRPSTSSYRA